MPTCTRRPDIPARSRWSSAPIRETPGQERLPRDRRRGRLRAAGHAGDGVASRPARPAPGAPRPRPVAAGSPLHVGEIFSVESEGEPGDAYPATPVSGARSCTWRSSSTTSTWRRWLIERGADVNARATRRGGAHAAVPHRRQPGLGDGPMTTTRRRGSSSTMGPIPTPGRPSRRRPRSTARPPPSALHDVTPVGYARRYPDRRVLNEAAIAAIEERGGTE